MTIEAFGGDSVSKFATELLEEPNCEIARQASRAAPISVAESEAGAEYRDADAQVVPKMDAQARSPAILDRELLTFIGANACVIKSAYGVSSS